MIGGKWYFTSLVLINLFIFGAFWFHAWVQYQLASQSVEPGNLQPNEIVIPRWIILGGLGAILALAALIRVRLLGVPLERDEGEYAYAGQLMLQGIPPYELAYNMKLPGTYAAYALIMAVFGQTGFSIHVGWPFFDTEDPRNGRS